MTAPERQAKFEFLVDKYQELISKVNHSSIQYNELLGAVSDLSSRVESLGTGHENLSKVFLNQLNSEEFHVEKIHKKIDDQSSKNIHLSGNIEDLKKEFYDHKSGMAQFYNAIHCLSDEQKKYLKFDDLLEIQKQHEGLSSEVKLNFQH